MKKVILAFVLLLFSSSTLALNNESKPIRLVESLAGDKIYIHLKEPMEGQPACASYSSIIACSTTEGYCGYAMSIALAAHAAGREIDFEIDGSCIGTAAKFTRLRMR